jgi:hypothetical protein
MIPHHAPRVFVSKNNVVAFYNLITGVEVCVHGRYTILFAGGQ